MKVKYFLILLFTILLVSCDPMQTIEIEIKSDHTSVVKFFFTGEGYYKFDEFLTKDSLVVSLDSGEVKAFYFGTGTCEIHNSLDSLASRMALHQIEWVCLFWQHEGYYSFHRCSWAKEALVHQIC